MAPRSCAPRRFVGLRPTSSTHTVTSLQTSRTPPSLHINSPVDPPPLVMFRLPPSTPPPPPPPPPSNPPVTLAGAAVAAPRCSRHPTALHAISRCVFSSHSHLILPICQTPFFLSLTDIFLRFDQPVARRRAHRRNWPRRRPRRRNGRLPPLGEAPPIGPPSPPGPPPPRGPPLGSERLTSDSLCSRFSLQGVVVRGGVPSQGGCPSPLPYRWGPHRQRSRRPLRLVAQPLAARRGGGGGWTTPPPTVGRRPPRDERPHAAPPP